MRGSNLFVGLGNPGPEYVMTRHNIGWLVLDRFAEEVGVELTEQVGEALLGRRSYAGSKLVVMKPLSFMNLSGRPVAKVLAAEGLTSANMVVIHDDLDLEPGQLKLQVGRGAGGHNGVLSLQERLGSNDFARLRVGIGRSDLRGGMRDFVLESFGEAELTQVVGPAVDRAVEALKSICARGLVATMNEVNRRPREHEEEHKEEE